MPQKAKSTQRNEGYILPTLAKAFGLMVPANIKPHHVWSYWRERGETSGARHEIRVLSAVMTFAKQCGAVDVNPCEKLGLPTEDPRDRYVTDEEFLAVRGIEFARSKIASRPRIKKLRPEAPARERAPQGVALRDRTPPKLQVILWTLELRELIDLILGHPDFPRLRAALICTQTGQPYSGEGFKTMWQRTLDRAVHGVRDPKTGELLEPPTLEEAFHFHDLRAKSASEAETDQASADRLGHSDAKVTRRVYRRLPKIAQPAPLPTRI
jgi:integrase